MEENENMVDESSDNGTFKQWIQDNLRIIISIIIVVSIAGGIYSYSKRSAEETLSVEQRIEQGDKESNKQDNGTAVAKDAVAEKTTAKTADKQVTPAPASQETENSFVETAGKGDGMTHLARRSLANYLEKNSDSELTVEHKIYIEDYLRKHVAKKGIHAGTTIEFSKDLIKEAVSKSKTLNEKQLNNLHKYAVRTPSLK